MSVFGYRLFFLFLFGLGILHPCTAQKGGIPLADEYYKNAEYAKARSIYINFTSDLESAKKVYSKYVDCLIKLKDYEEGEKFLKKIIKWDNLNPVYKLDLADIYSLQSKTSDAKKQIDKIIKTCISNPEYIEQATELLSKKGFFNECKQIYLNARKQQGNPLLYSLELAELYKQDKNIAEMLAELVHVLVANQNDKEFLKSRFQDFITTQEEIKKFEELIIGKIQENPSEYLYNDLLIWLYVQQREFYRAFLQAKAYDKLVKSQGNKLMEVGKIAMENRAYDNAIDIFDYVIREYKSSPNYAQARKLKILSKEESIKYIYPVDPEKIRSLISDYQGLIKELGKNPQTLDPLRSTALLYGFYLNSKDTAIMILEEIVKYPWVDFPFAAKCKLDLGDIYVLKNEPWEATLIYSQVEKMMKDQPLGHEAKLKNAKLSYYTGQFEFAQEHLDVLKLATSREIANDAMDLSLFIQDNIGMDDDSMHLAMQEYASIELLLFQHKYAEAMSRLDTLLRQNKDHSLTDEIYYLQAKTYRKLGKYEEAILKLETIANLYKADIYGDDAAFMLAEIYEQNLKNEFKAMDLYNKFLIDFPASIYTSEARKRFRSLRGDHLN